MSVSEKKRGNFKSLPSCKQKEEEVSVRQKRSYVTPLKI